MSDLPFSSNKQTNTSGKMKMEEMKMLKTNKQPPPPPLRQYEVEAALGCQLRAASTPYRLSLVILSFSPLSLYPYYLFVRCLRKAHRRNFHVVLYPPIKKTNQKKQNFSLAFFCVLISFQNADSKLCI